MISVDNGGSGWNFSYFDVTTNTFERFKITFFNLKFIESNPVTCLS